MSDNFDLTPSIYVDIFELNCYDDRVPYDRIECFSHEQALKLRQAYEAQVISPSFDNDRVEEIKELLSELILFVARRSINLKISLCEEDRALSVSMSSPFLAFHKYTMHYLIKIAQASNNIAFFYDTMNCTFLLDKQKDN